MAKNTHPVYLRCSIRSGITGIINKQNWEAATQEIEQLCKLYDEAIANSEKCSEFANRISLFLSELEDLKCQSMANMAMDILLLCNPKVASHCDKASMEKGRLEQMLAEIGKKRFFKPKDCEKSLGKKSQHAAVLLKKPRQLALKIKSPSRASCQALFSRLCGHPWAR